MSTYQESLPEQTYKKVHKIIFWISLSVLVALFLSFYLYNFHWDEPRVSLDQLLNGTAHRPFVYRVLIPLLTRLTTRIFPFESVLVVIALMYTFLVGFVLSLRYLAHNFWKPSITIDWASLASLIVLMPVVIYNRKIYDFSTLFFFTLGLGFLVRQKWSEFLILYLVACLNKETSILLTLIYLVVYFRILDRRKYLSILFIQLLIYFGTRLGLMIIFRNNPGSVVEFHLLDYLMIFNLQSLTILHLYYLACIIYVIIGGIAAFHQIKNKPRFLRQAAIIVVPVLFVLSTLFAIPFELRDYIEAFPVLYLLAVPSVFSIIGLKFEPVGEKLLT